MKPECPICKDSDAVRQSGRRYFDSLLRLVALYPFRCGLCDHRFYRFFKPRLRTVSQ